MAGVDDWFWDKKGMETANKSGSWFRLALLNKQFSVPEMFILPQPPFPPIPFLFNLYPYKFVIFSVN